MKQKMNLIILTLIASLGFCLIIPSSSVLASCSGGQKILTFPFWYDGALDANCNPTGSESQMVNRIILNVADIIFQSVAYISVVFVIIGGFKYMTAMGDQGMMASAKKTIVNAVTGLVIGALSSAIINLVFKTFMGSSSSSGGLPEVNLDNTAIKNGLNTAFGWAGVICVIVIIGSGLLYVTAVGDQAKITKAKKTLIGAVIGLIVVIMSFAIVNFVLGSIG